MYEAVNPFINYPVLSKDDFQEIWRDIFNLLHLWRDEDEVLGLVVISTGTHRIKHIAYLDKLAINQSLEQRKGLGTIFFQEIFSSLHTEGFTKIELGAEVDNKRAISFGFVIEGVQKNLLNREDEFVDNYYMAKML